MSTYLTATAREEQTAMPETHLLARALMPRVIDPSFAAKRAFIAGWQVTDQIAQGVRINRCDVTDVHKFSTRMGPPPCSPPV